MTAEIAILNKEAVALAADSAVTISAGRKEERIFDSADKLFELSNHNPIGIMIYNGMSFMEAPLPSLIRQFRSICPNVVKVEDAANRFLSFLNGFGKRSPEAIKNRTIISLVSGVISGINDRFASEFQKKINEIGSSKAVEVPDYNKIISDVLDAQIDMYLGVLESCEDANFMGDESALTISKAKSDLLLDIIQGLLGFASAAQKQKLLQIAKLSLRKNVLSQGLTGIVIAGFGDNEIFPTLLSFEMDGMVCDRLKYVRTNNVDIDRQGTKAKVLPFAQKEMVERFLYGLDDRIQQQVTDFCNETITDIRTGILDHITFEKDSDKASISLKAQEAEDAFLNGLRTRAFEKIRSQSQIEIEDMVEFMPKPELAKMQGCLVLNTVARS
jgi:hypothetical protein